jgi:hypothetical protein
MECCKYIYDLSAKEYENLRHVIDTIFFCGYDRQHFDI